MKKTTKIIGAVLGVLLVAALFTGAGAAATQGGTYYAYVPYDDLTDGQIWYLLNDLDKPTATQIVTVKNADDDIYFDGLVEEGRYQCGNKWVLVKFPEIIAKADIYRGAIFVGSLDGGFVPKSPDYNVKISGIKTVVADTAKVAWQLIDANGAATKVDVDGVTGIVSGITGKNVGEYALVPYLADGVLVKGAPEGMEYGEPFFFTIGKADDEKVELSAETVNAGKTFVATFYGLPGVDYVVTAGPDGKVSIPEQKGIKTVNNNKQFTMGPSGVFDISIKADNKTDEATITVYKYKDTQNEKSFDASIEITDGVLTAEAEYDAYTIGADIKLFGTSSGKDLYFFIEGINVPFKELGTYNNQGQLTEPVSVTDEEWEKKLLFSDITGTIGSPDAGTYTIYVTTVAPTKTGGIWTAPSKDNVTKGTYVTVPVALKQSFITITDAPTAVAQGEKIVIEGTANAAQSVLWYLFGTNFFEAGVQKVKDDAFKITIEKDYTKSDYMAAGQYFLVIQHPMYDGMYSIAPNKMYDVAADGTITFWGSGESSLSKDVVLDSILKSDKNGIYTSGSNLSDAAGHKLSADKKSFSGDAVEIFDNNVRQTANAAEALCRALDSQNFDEMYAKASFIVGAPTSVINPIPAKIAQGEILKISGTTTGHVGEIVSVEFLATAFAAVPKEAVGTAAFVTVNTKVQDDGTWAIEFDTSNLNVDDYTVSVAVGQLGPTTSKITVVKAGEPVPTQTTVPTGQPTTAPTTAPTQTPASPGFGILAALAGLGAVAVLLLRRQ